MSENPKNDEIFGMHFQFISPIHIEETLQGKTIISGTLLVEGISRNKNKYTIDEMANIAKNAVGKSIKFGTEAGIDPFSGKFEPNLHAQGDEHIVGKVIKTVLDKIKRKIKFWAEIFNTQFHPNIAESVKNGWGISIDGLAKGGQWVYDKLKGLVLKVRGVKIRWIQLVRPEIQRGQDEAKIENVTIQETLKMSACNPFCILPCEPEKESKIIKKKRPIEITFVF